MDISSASLSSPNSPLRGLERLSEELRFERQKSSQAMQERARNKIEIESYKQMNEAQKNEIAALNDQVAELREHITRRDDEIQEYKRKDQEQLQSLSQLHYQCTTLDDTIHQFELENERLKDSLQQRDNEVQMLEVKLETLEKRFQTKEELIGSLKRDLIHFRQSSIGLEQEKIQNYHQLSENSVINEELQAAVKFAEALEEGYNQCKASNAQIREELEASLALNTSLNAQVRELNALVREKSISEKEKLEEVVKMSNESLTMEKLLQEAELERDESRQRLSAEIAATQAAKEQAESASRTRMLIESQLSTLRSAYEDALARSEELEREVTDGKVSISALNLELTDMREKQAQMESMQKQLVGMQSMSIEIENLRSQLQLMRKKLVKREIEEEAAIVAPKAALEREQQGRKVYETIIQDLRSEVDKISNKYHETVRRLDEALVQVARVDQLQEEVDMYKEMAKSVTADSQTVALTAAEVAERSIKSNHERHTMAKELQQAETELHSSRLEIDRQKQEIFSLKDKLKSFHSAKLASDTRVTDMMAANSRLEAALEEFRQQYDLLSIELEKAKRTIHDQNYQLADLKLKAAELDKAKSDCENLQRRMHESSMAMAAQEKQINESLESIRHEHQFQSQELESTKQQLSVQRHAYDRLQSENGSLQDALESLRNQCDRMKKDAVDQEAFRAEQQLLGIQRDLAQTMQDWQDLEREKTAKDHLIEQLQVDYGKEKEKAIFQKMQIDLLEERLRVVSQELSVYRSIDVYHSSMQAELSLYKKEKEDSVVESDPLQSSSSKQQFSAMKQKSSSSAPMSTSPKRSTSRLSIDDITAVAADVSVNNGSTPLAGSSLRASTSILSSYSKPSSLPVRPFSATTPIPATPFSAGHLNSDIEEDSYSEDTGSESVDQHRLELQRQRAARKAARDKLLKEKILAEERRRNKQMLTMTTPSNNSQSLATPSLISTQKGEAKVNLEKARRMLSM